MFPTRIDCSHKKLHRQLIWSSLHKTWMNSRRCARKAAGIRWRKQPTYKNNKKPMIAILIIVECNANSHSSFGFDSNKREVKKFKFNKQVLMTEENLLNQHFCLMTEENAIWIKKMSIEMKRSWSLRNYPNNMKLTAKRAKRQLIDRPRIKRMMDDNR